MALRPIQNICVVCGNVVLTDSTGGYNATENPEGYGSPNADFGATAPYTVSFFPPVYLAKNSKAPEAPAAPLLTLDLNLSPPAPDEDGHYVWTLTPEAFGYGQDGVLKSGVWKVVVTFGAVVTEIFVLITNDIQERVLNCICSDPCKVGMYAQLQVARIMFQEFRNDQAQQMIARLYKDTECCCDCGGA
jgi:hypothetical protein